MATKIKDGLFIGDAEASQDPEFIELNKITFVINCAGHQLPNLWEQHGLHYLTFPWTSEPNCVLFDGGNVVVVQASARPDCSDTFGRKATASYSKGYQYPLARIFCTTLDGNIRMF